MIKVSTKWFISPVGSIQLIMHIQCGLAHTEFKWISTFSWGSNNLKKSELNIMWNRYLLYIRLQAFCLCFSDNLLNGLPFLRQLNKFSLQCRLSEKQNQKMCLRLEGVASEWRFPSHHLCNFWRNIMQQKHVWIASYTYKKV